MNLWIVPIILFVILIILTIRKKFDKKWKKVVLLLLLIVGVLFSIFRFIVPLKPSLEPTGDEDIKYYTHFYKHKTNFSNMATKGDEREIPVHIWTPKNLEENSHKVFVFSHGSFGVGLSNETLFKELASRGYIVLSLDHPHHSFFSTLSDGSRVYVDGNFMQNVMASQGSEDLEKTLQDLNNWLDIRLEDIEFVLEEITDENRETEFEKAMDLNEIVLSGHSLGGSAMLGIGRKYPEKFKKMVILESPFVKDISKIENGEFVFISDDYPVSILHIYSDALYGKMDEITTYEMNQRLIDKKDPKFVNKHIFGVGHIGLTDMSLISPIITNLIDGGLNTRQAPETLIELNKIVLEYLENL